jgi:hypothetical protein
MSDRNTRSAKCSEVDEARRIAQSEFVELCSTRIQTHFAIEAVRTLFREHAGKIRFLARLSSAAVADPGAEIYLCFAVSDGRLAVVSSSSAKRVRYLSMSGEHPDLATIRAERERASLLLDATIAAASSGRLDDAPVLGSSNFSAWIKGLIGALPAEPIVIEIDDTRQLLPARPRDPLVATTDEVFDDCWITSMKFDDGAKVQATSALTGKKMLLNVALQGDTVAVARLRLFACSGTRFSLTARALQVPPGEVRYSPLATRPLEPVADQLRLMMKQAELDR